MDSRQRVRAALEHQEPDRTPYFEYVLLSPVADALLGRRCAGDPAHWSALVDECGWEEAVNRNAADRLDLALLLGHDLLYVTPNPPPPVPPTAPAPPEPLPEDPVERLRRRNVEAARQAPPSDETLAVYVRLLELMRQRGVDLPILAPAYVHGVWTDTELMQTMLLAPEVAEEHFALATRRALARIEKYLELGIELVGVGGDFSGTRPLISPAAYQHFIVPQVRVLSRRLHAGSAFAINASDGDLWPVIDDFLCGCEVDGYLEIDRYAGMDLGRLKAAYGERICLFGNLDCGNTLSFGTPESIRQETLDCLEAGRGKGGHILCASNAITASVPLENYLAVVRAYREWCGLPALGLGG
jgi:uroporphyrinogen decarboxylase